MAGLSREQRMAFYINTYNQLIVRTLAHACTDHVSAHAHSSVVPACMPDCMENPRGSMTTLCRDFGRCMAWCCLDRLRAP